MSSLLTLVLILVEVLKTAGVEARRSTDDTVDLVALFQQDFGAADRLSEITDTTRCERTGKSRPGQ